MTEDQRWMSEALAQAELAQAVGEVPVGAVLVRDGQLISSGYNQPILSNDPTAHAEIVVLRAAAAREKNYRLTGTTLYVTIEPCAMCAGALVHSRVQRLVFGATEPRAGAVCSHLKVLDAPNLNHRVVWEQGVCADQAVLLLKTFFGRKR